MYEMTTNDSLRRMRSNRRKAERKQPPTIDQLREWMNDGGCEATDGCWVEPDGECEHGCKSWLLELGMI